MKSNNLTYQLITRSVLLAISSALFGYISIVLSVKETFFIPFLIATLVLIQIIELIRFIRNINRRILDYISTLKVSDLSINEDKISPYSFEQVKDSLNDLMQIINESKYEKEIHKQYLNLIINYIKVGLISYNQKHEIVLYNKTSKKILGKNNINNLKELDSICHDFYTEIIDLENRNNKLITLIIDSEQITLTISKSVLKIKNETITNITFQDIRNEIVQNEIESWRRLIKVLRHEILNSITPISTLTDTIISIINNDNGKQKSLNQLKDEDIEDISESMKSIKSRSNGLFDFVNIYREIDKIPEAKFEIISVIELLQSIKPLFNKKINDNGIDFKIVIEEKQMYLNADFALIQQVLINLVKNSIEALSNTEIPQITIRALKSNNEITISITDNGKGIPDSQINQIFVPFFTTKETGSGIGLFLSRQIMQLHNGIIKAKSVPDKGTDFVLSFNIAS